MSSFARPSGLVAEQRELQARASLLVGPLLRARGGEAEGEKSPAARRRQGSLPRTRAEGAHAMNHLSLAESARRC
mgnify:CR=1 FL=1